MSQGEAQTIRQKLFEQKKRIYDAEEKFASQQDTIRQLSESLVKAAARERAQEFPETRLELAAAKRDLEDARRLVESKDAEIENLLPQAVVNRINGSHCLRSKDSEIQHLRLELDKTRSELAAVHPQLQEARQRLEHKDAELDRLLPKVLAARMNPSQGIDVDQLRRELIDTRAELARKNVELQLAHQDVQNKADELRCLRAEMGVSRVVDLQSLQCKEAELARLRDNHEKDLAARFRSETFTTTPRVEHAHFDKACVDMEIYLERREQAIEEREAKLPPEHGGSYGGSVPCGSLWDQLQR